jgi:hypothetical protein
MLPRAAPRPWAVYGGWSVAPRIGGVFIKRKIHADSEVLNHTVDCHLLLAFGDVTCLFPRHALQGGARTSSTLQSPFWGVGPGGRPERPTAERPQPPLGVPPQGPRPAARGVDLAKVHMPIADQHLPLDPFPPDPLTGQGPAGFVHNRVVRVPLE